ncbi:MAG: class I SAM-dependent methyltransferase [Rhodospirillaceae bacterium]|nr:class I SAM-dependent methyltransferase [Rhodospirillaceae bacterium]
MDIKELDVLGDGVAQHWYFKSKANALSHFLRGNNFTHIFDVGAGSGFFSRYLLNTTDAHDALCVDSAYERDWDETTNGKQLYFRQNAFAHNTDLILMMDVIEHVDDELSFIKNYTQSAKSGTLVMATVPAFEFLWSSHDVFLEHRRRYTLSGLKTTLENSNLEIVKISYGFGLVFPIAATLRLMERFISNNKDAKSGLKPHHPFVNSALTAMCAAERPLMHLNKLAGLSVFCLARKP